MQLVINHQRHTLQPIREFRVTHHLSETFGVAYFEPKDETGLAHLSGAGDALLSLKQAILEAIPPFYITLPTLDFLERLTALFKHTLYAVNTSIGLKPVEVEYAVGGFGDVLTVWFYDYIRALQSKTDVTPFDSLYDEWSANSGRRSETVHPYEHSGQMWQVRILNNAYGRVGLQVDMPHDTAYVLDTVYLCPAEGFMRGLLGDVIAKLTIRPSI